MNSLRSLRITELMKEFSRHGYEVTLLTPKDDNIHVPFEKKYGVTIKLALLNFPKMKLNSKNGMAKLFKRAVRQALLQLFEYPDVGLMFRVRKALEKVKTLYVGCIDYTL